MNNEQELRDGFAAAAMAGMLAREDSDGSSLHTSCLTEYAYRIADAMLRERTKPATAEPPKPVLWAVHFAGWPLEEQFVFRSRREAESAAGVSPSESAIVPLYRDPPQHTLTDAEREAVAYYVGTGGPDAIDATLRTLLARHGVKR